MTDPGFSFTAAGGDDARLRRLLGRPETTWILERIRARLGRGQALTGSITLTSADESQRAAVGRLLGRSVSAGRSVSVPLERLDEMLRTSGAWPAGLASAVVALTGPVEDPREREAEREAWQTVSAQLNGLSAARPELTGWVDGVRSSGRLKRVAVTADDAARLVTDLRAVITELPAEGESLAGFAARVLHSAHALDAGTPLGSLAVSAGEALGGPVGGPAGDPVGPRPGSAAWRRAVWASVGVLVDDLSSTVLLLNMPGGPSSATARSLGHLATAGQPAVLTLRQIVPAEFGVVPPVVHVCENPAVVSAAADRLGASSLPLVCLQGQPGTAAVALLRRLRDGGAELRYHGDFDWGGVVIARTLASQVEWVPWRFGAGHYRGAVRRVRRGEKRGDSLPGLTGAPVDTPWDPELRAMMLEYGVRVEEEVVIDDLLADLGDTRNRL